MHEILAPLLFVLYSDLQAYEHANENKELSHIPPADLTVLNTVYDSKYLEHDGYTMFCEIMLSICKWYEDAETPPHPPEKVVTPFMRYPPGGDSLQKSV